MSNRLSWIEHELEKLEQQSLLRVKTTRESPPVGGLVQVDGRQFINFGSNDYLGIAASEELVQAVHQSIGQVGFGAGSSPLVSGRGTLHRKLESELAIFEGTESALLFPTGFAANVGTICSLVGDGDVVFSDQLNHASIIDGCRLSGATVEVYPHRDLNRLAERLLHSSTFNRRLIVTDGLFSMDGDIAPLSGLCELAEKFDAMVMVDEAHATGVLGDNGRGSCEWCGVENRVDIRVGTLSKALGTFGGFVVGNESLTHWIFNRARSYVFSTAQPEIIAAASSAALKIVVEQPHRRTELLSRASQLRKRLQASGFDTRDSNSQIVPVIIGRPDETVRISRQLMDCGIYVPAIRPPSVPAGESRLRISLSFDHNEQQIEDLLEGLIAADRKNQG